MAPRETNDRIHDTKSGKQARGEPLDEVQSDLFRPSCIPSNSKVYSGVDLSTSPANTGVAFVANGPAGLVAWRLPAHLPANDRLICRIFGFSEAMAIDVPLGWPNHFVRALRAHRQGRPYLWPPLGHLDDVAWRVTDKEIHTRLSIDPLRVTADRIGKTAMRGAAIQSVLPNGPYPRDGSEKIIETYPAAVLKALALRHNGYKQGPECRKLRSKLLVGLSRAFKMTFRPNLARQCVDSHDLLDAVICAIIAHEAKHGRTVTPTTRREKFSARTEGWIHTP